MISVFKLNKHLHDFKQLSLMIVQMMKFVILLGAMEVSPGQEAKQTLQQTVLICRINTLMRMEMCSKQSSRHFVLKQRNT